MVFSFSFSVFLGISKGFAQKNNLPEFPPKKRKNPSILDWSIPRFSRLFSSRGIPRPQIPRFLVSHKEILSILFTHQLVTFSKDTIAVDKC